MDDRITAKVNITNGEFDLDMELYFSKSNPSYMEFVYLHPKTGSHCYMRSQIFSGWFYQDFNKQQRFSDFIDKAMDLEISQMICPIENDTECIIVIDSEGNVIDYKEKEII